MFSNPTVCIPNSTKEKLYVRAVLCKQESLAVRFKQEKSESLRFPPNIQIWESRMNCSHDCPLALSWKELVVRVQTRLVQANN